MIGRRGLVMSGAAAAVSALAGSSKHLVAPASNPASSSQAPALAQSRIAAVPAAPTPEPRIVQEAIAALDRHSRMVPHRDRLAVVDFSVPSAQPRMKVIDLASGKAKDFLVAHGSGSDPGHTGYLHKFSNVPDSNASSQGRS